MISRCIFSGVDDFAAASDSYVPAGAGVAIGSKPRFRMAHCRVMIMSYCSLGSDCSELATAFGWLLIQLERFEPTGTLLDRASIRLHQTIVRPNACLGVDAPIMVIAGRLSAWIRGRLRELAFPHQCRTKIRVAAIKAHGMIENGSLLHDCTLPG